MGNMKESTLILDREIIKEWKEPLKGKVDTRLMETLGYLMNRFHISHRPAMDVLQSLLESKIKLPNQSTVRRYVSNTPYRKVHRYFEVSKSVNKDHRYINYIDDSQSEKLQLKGVVKGKRIYFKGMDTSFLIKPNRVRASLSLVENSQNPISQWWLDHDVLVTAMSRFFNIQTEIDLYKSLIPLLSTKKIRPNSNLDNFYKELEDNPHHITLPNSRCYQPSIPEEAPLRVLLLPFEYRHDAKVNEVTTQLVLWVRCGYSGMNFIYPLPPEYAIDDQDLRQEIGSFQYQIFSEKIKETILISLSVSVSRPSFNENFQVEIPFREQSNKQRKTIRLGKKTINKQNFGYKLPTRKTLLIPSTDFSQMSIPFSTLNADYFTYNQLISVLEQWVIYLNMNAELNADDIDLFF
tara:strand:+ start:1025 stop:2245 length:1221 start_codon:yes stop_codon:yes gene_type:complete